MRIAVTFIILGAVLICYSLSLPAYTDEQLFMERYMSLSSGQSEEYWKLRDEMLTPKYRVQDYGGTAFSIGLGLLLLGWISYRTPKARWVLVALATMAPLISMSALVFDLFQGAARGEFPHWADSLGIPLMGAPIQLVVLLVWSFSHLAFLKAPYQVSVPLGVALSRKANRWLLFLSAITALLVCLCLAEGAYWYAIPGALWLYLYLSLAAGKRAANGIQPTLQADAPASGRSAA